LILLAVQLPAEGGDAIPLLSRPIRHFSIGKTSVVDALFWLGHDEGVCFGIEFSGNDLNREVRVEVNQTTVGEVVQKILGSADTFQVLVSGKVVLIRKKGEKPPAWLDRQLPEFTLPRTELMAADNVLWMTLERDMNPSLRGFAGDFPATDPVDEVGPFREQKRTVQQLLIKIVTGSRGAGWFPSTYGVRTSFPAASNRFWTFVTYSGRTSARPKYDPANLASNTGVRWKQV
jgi:hypothetical protein